MLDANVASKIIIKNTTSAFDLKKINLSILTKLKKKIKNIKIHRFIFEHEYTKT